MAKVVHTINGHPYLYKHTRVGKKVVCKYLGRVGGSGGRSYQAAGSTRVASSQYNSYDDQADLDTEVRRAYQQGYGVKKIQRIFEDIDLHPTRRMVENYLVYDLGLELRKRAPKPTIYVHDPPTELAQAESTIALQDIKMDSKNAHITQMKAAAIQDAAKIAALEGKLRDYRDMGRAPTAEEIEELFR